MKTELKDVNYAGFKSVNFTNGLIELYIPKEIGPRILFAGFKGEKNLFEVTEPSACRKTRLGMWRLYGGHRLWTAPEIVPNTYYPDNEKICINYSKETLTLSQHLNKLMLVKEIKLKYIDKNKIQVVHNIYNNSNRNIKIALWALSVMAKGGIAIIPQKTEKEDKYNLLPNRNIVLWPYSDINDPRLIKHRENFYIKQGGEKPFKIGQRAPSGYASYFNKGYLFVKKFKYNSSKEYTDFHSNVEVYSCKGFLELETLSSYENVKSGSSIAHIEIWEFYKNIKNCSCPSVLQTSGSKDKPLAC